MAYIKRTRWNPGGPPGIAAPRLNNIEQAISLANAYEGAEIVYTWEDGLPTKATHKDEDGNVIKEIDYTWQDGLPTQEVYTLRDFDDDGTLINTTTFTIDRTWQDGLPIKEVVS